MRRHDVRPLNCFCLVADNALLALSPRSLIIKSNLPLGGLVIDTLTRAKHKELLAMVIMTPLKSSSATTNVLILLYTKMKLNFLEMISVQRQQLQEGLAFSQFKQLLNGCLFVSKNIYKSMKQYGEYSDENASPKAFACICHSDVVFLSNFVFFFFFPIYPCNGIY